MRAHGSPYRRTDPARYSRAFGAARHLRALVAARYPRVFLLLTLLAFPLVTAGCGPRQVWGIPADQLSAALAHGDYASLSTVDLRTGNPDEALGLAPDAPYYLSYVFDAVDRPDDALAMLETAWSRSPSPWKEEAGVLLADRYNKMKSWDKAAAVARRLLSVGGAAPGSGQGGAGTDPSTTVEQRARRALVEALYWSQDDASVLEEASRLVSPDAEVLLFRAVSSLRLGLAPAHDLVMKLFLDERTSALHARFATFLAAQPGYLPVFSKADQDVIQGRNDLAGGAWSTALPLLEDALAGPDPSPLAHSALLMDMGNAYASAGRSAAGAAFMQRLSTRLVGQPRADALEQAGKLYRRARDYGQALTLLRTIAEEAPTLDQRDRARWFILDILFALAPADLPARVEAEAAHWNDPTYFADVLEDRLSDLVSARKWTTLDALRRALAARGPDTVLAELDYVLARALQVGRIRDLAGTSAAELFADAARRDPSGYYGILASSMLGQVPDRAVAGRAPPVGPAEAPLDPFIMGFLSYGLGDEAYQRLWDVHQGLTDGQVLDAARRFAAAGDLRSSLYFVGALARRRKLDAAEMELYYPRGYADLLEPLASAAGIPQHVLYGLVREESYFDANVVSSAGAVGLSQLMPATALPLARKLKLTDPDLRNPATNLAIGVRHLQDLLGNVDNPVKALLAYNAGLSRLRQWERAASSLPPDLLVESVPIAETRQYVRKILVSSVMYAFLYGDTDPREAALSFFGIKPPPAVVEERPPVSGQQKTGSRAGAS